MVSNYFYKLRFYFNKSSLEDKMSRSRHSKITIANETKLDYSFLEHLYLAPIMILELPEGGNTLVEKIN